MHTPGAQIIWFPRSGTMRVGTGVYGGRIGTERDKAGGLEGGAPCRFGFSLMLSRPNNKIYSVTATVSTIWVKLYIER